MGQTPGEATATSKIARRNETFWQPSFPKQGAKRQTSLKPLSWPTSRMMRAVFLFGPNSRAKTRPKNVRAIGKSTNHAHDYDDTKNIMYNVRTTSHVFKSMVVCKAPSSPRIKVLAMLQTPSKIYHPPRPHQRFKSWNLQTWSASYSICRNTSQLRGDVHCRINSGWIFSIEKLLNFSHWRHVNRRTQCALAIISQKEWLLGRQIIFSLRWMILASWK